MNYTIEDFVEHIEGYFYNRGMIVDRSIFCFDERGIYCNFYVWEFAKKMQSFKDLSNTQISVHLLEILGKIYIKQKVYKSLKEVKVEVWFNKECSNIRSFTISIEKLIEGKIIYNA